MRKSNVEFKVGIFVFVALAILSLLVLKAGDFYIKPGYTIRLVFDFVSGIDRGSPVRLAGVTVGEIKEITVVRDEKGQTRVEMRCWIMQGVFIEADAEARINALGLLGEKYVEILPGTTGAPVLGDGGTLVGYTPVLFEKLTESGGRLIQKVERAIDNVNEVVADPAFKNSVRSTFSNASDTFGSANHLMQDLTQVSTDLKETAQSARIVMGRLRDGEGTVGKLLKEETIANDLEAFVKDIKANPWKLLKKS